MKGKNVLFASKEWVGTQRVASFLHELADRIAAGQVTFRREAEEVSVAVPPELMLEVAVEERKKRDGMKRSIDIEIEWIEGGRGGVSLG